MNFPARANPPFKCASPLPPAKMKVGEIRIKRRFRMFCQKARLQHRAPVRVENTFADSHDGDAGMRQRIARAGLRKQQRKPGSASRWRVWAARRDNNRIGLPSGVVATLTRLAKGKLVQASTSQAPRREPNGEAPWLAPAHHKAHAKGRRSRYPSSGKTSI